MNITARYEYHCSPVRVLIRIRIGRRFVTYTKSAEWLTLKRFPKMAN
jgi:hypothetical protein